jgi:hypothetical protein
MLLRNPVEPYWEALCHSCTRSIARMLYQELKEAEAEEMIRFYIV